MRVRAVKVDGGWDVYPESGTFQGKLIGKADGLSLRAVDFHSGEVSGELSGVWGLQIYDPTVFDDPRTVKGLRIGQSFNMGGRWLASGRTLEELLVNKEGNKPPASGD